MVQRHAFGETGHREFRRAVSHAITDADDAADGREVDDVARFSLEHVRQKGFRDVEHTAHVDRIEPVQIRAARLHHRADVADAGVVHQHIHSSLAVENCFRDALAILFARHIQREKFGLAFLRFESAGRFASAFFVAVGDEYKCAGARERFRNCRANAGARARDEGDFVLEVEHVEDGIWPQKSAKSTRSFVNFVPSCGYGFIGSSTTPLRSTLPRVSRSLRGCFSLSRVRPDRLCDPIRGECR